MIGIKKISVERVSENMIKRMKLCLENIFNIYRNLFFQTLVIWMIVKKDNKVEKNYFSQSLVLSLKLNWLSF